MSNKYIPAGSVDNRLNVEHLTPKLRLAAAIITLMELLFHYSLATAATVLCPLMNYTH